MEICGVISNCGPHGEPLACGYPKSSEDSHVHSWASIPTVLTTDVDTAFAIAEAASDVWVSDTGAGEDHICSVAGHLWGVRSRFDALGMYCKACGITEAEEAHYRGRDGED